MIARCRELPEKILLSLSLGLMIISPTYLYAGRGEGFYDRLAQAALQRTGHKVRYDGSYQTLQYPMGDVDSSMGVCTDVVIRSYRGLGIDLQQAVHEDMRRAFSDYPKHWGLAHPDSNIDHRRVPNLQTFFKRHGRKLTVTGRGQDYRPGDLVTWMLPGNLPHIGIVAVTKSKDGKRPLIVHNIGAGPKLEDMLFTYPITGHYRFGADYQGGGRFNPSGS